MVRNRGSRHLQFGHPIHHRLDFAGSIEQAVIGMEMKMNEFGVGHCLLDPRSYEGSRNREQGSWNKTGRKRK